MIKAKQLTKTFNHPQEITLFENLDLSVSPCESVAITGPSGIGKSTLLHILGTLELPTSGELFIGDVPVTEKNKNALRREEIGFIFQFYHLFEDLSVLENILMAERIARREPDIERAHLLLEKVNLGYRTNHPVHLLSGGEKQRVAIARALQNRPSIILADEPTGNLDAHNAKEIQDLLLSFSDECSLITVTHDINFAKKFQSVYQLDKGGFS